jgi:hypothetical protein
MRISPTPCYLRIICSRKQKRFLALIVLLVYFLFSDGLHNSSRRFLLFADRTYPTIRTECYTKHYIFHLVHAAASGLTFSTHSLFPIFDPCCPARERPNLLRIFAPFGSALPKRRLISHRAKVRGRLAVRLHIGSSFTAEASRAFLLPYLVHVTRTLIIQSVVDYM